VDGDAADLLADDLALAGVEPRPHFDAERPDTRRDGLGAANGSGRAVGPTTFRGSHTVRPFA